MRIAKAMARAGLCSRREAERWIADGRVAVNGKILTTPACEVGPADKILVDGRPLPAAEPVRLWRYHKIKGLVTTHQDPQGRPTVFDKLPPEMPRVISIGRLDYNTEGLLLLTNDGALARHLELPATGWLRRYRVRARGRVTQADLDKLKDGIEIEGVRYGAIEATIDTVQGANIWLTVGIREGKNREVRKVMAELGLEVSRLIRISFGPSNWPISSPAPSSRSVASTWPSNWAPRSPANSASPKRPSSARNATPAASKRRPRPRTTREDRRRQIPRPGHREPRHEGLRPTSDRVRESVFNILLHGIEDFSIDGIRVIDLFAGTGALGLEALSRGASYSLFVEEGAESRGLIRQNVEAFGLTGNTRLFRRDATDLGPAAPMQPFSLAFLDPPYGKGLGERAIASLIAGKWLTPGAVAVWEERASSAMPWPEGFTEIDRRTWGDTQVAFGRFAGD